MQRGERPDCRHPLRQAATSPIASNSKHRAAAFGRCQTLSNTHKYLYGPRGSGPPE